MYCSVCGVLSRMGSHCPCPEGFPPATCVIHMVPGRPCPASGREGMALVGMFPVLTLESSLALCLFVQRQLCFLLARPG